MTDEEIIQEAVARTIASLKTNGKTVGQLTPVNSYGASDYVELNGGRRVALTAIQEAVVAAIGGDLENLSADIAGMAIQVFTCSRTGTYAIVQIKQAGHTIKTATINIATQEFAGLMSAADKEKLDGMDAENLVAVVDLADIDDLKTADCQLATTPTRYAVKKTTSRGTVVVALLDILSDDMRHVVTQVITTHYVIENGVIDTSVHRDGELFRYYRSCKVSGGTLPVDAGEWTPWKPFVLANVEIFDSLSAIEGKTDEQKAAMVPDGNAVEEILLGSHLNKTDGTRYALIITGGKFASSNNCYSIMFPTEVGKTYIVKYAPNKYTGAFLLRNSTMVLGETANIVEYHVDAPSVDGYTYRFTPEESGLYLCLRDDDSSAGRQFPSEILIPNMITPDYFADEVTPNGSVPVKGSGVHKFVMNSGAMQTTNGLSLTKTTISASSLTWANKTPNGTSNTKRIVSTPIAIPDNCKQIQVKLSSTGTYGVQIIVYPTAAYSSPYYNCSGWDGSVDLLTMQISDALGKSLTFSIYGHKVSDANISATEIKNAISEIAFFSDTPRSIASEEKKKIHTLFIGNSLLQDAVAWLPYVIKTGGIDVDFSFLLCYNGGYTLSQQWTKISGQGNFEIISVCQNSMSWTNYANSKTLDFILENYQFDTLVLQEYFNYQDTPDLTAFENIVDYIMARTSFPFEVVSFIHAPKRDNVETIYARTVAGNQLILNNTCATRLMNAGTAIYDALSTALDSMGSQGHLSPDGTHAQEGLPCVLEALNLLGWYCNRLGLPYGVVNYQFSTDMSTVYSTLNIPGPNGSVLTGTMAQKRLATKVAAQSIRELAKIELGLNDRLI